MFCTLLLIVYNIEEANKILHDYNSLWPWSKPDRQNLAILNLQKLIDELWDCSIEMFGEHRYWDLVSDACICIIAIRRSLE